MKTVMLSFDIEEFDMPKEYGMDLTLEEQIDVSTRGTSIILDLVRSHRIPATFFSTVIFARNAREIIKRIASEGHELASHGFYHSSFENQHLHSSRIALEELSGLHVRGFRMPRMKAVDNELLESAGYTYNSSLNPVYLPGRYNNFFKSRTVFKTGDLIQLPASATPVVRFPLFWLSFHNTPFWLYKVGCRVTINADSYLNIYFHPWEFIDISAPAYGLPKYVTNKSGTKMIEQFNSWITWMKDQGYSFSTITNYVVNSKFKGSS